MTSQLLIVGITGGVGTAVAQKARAAGFRVRALHRNPDGLTDLRDVEIVRGDAMNAEDVRRAAEGCSFVLHAANPPQYRNWETIVVPMARNAADAARAVGARLLVPGNIYNFGLDAFPLIAEGAPQRAITMKGKVRVAMEQALRDSGARVTILRAGDFFGSHAPASWFQTVMAPSGKPLKHVVWPGSEAAGHSFAYLPDLAETFVRLMQCEGKMAQFEDLNFAGHHLTRGRAFAERAALAAGLSAHDVRRFPWALVRLAWPFVPLVRQIFEMRYLWQHDAALDNARLLAHLGHEPHTDLDEALKQSLKSLGCLQQPLEAGPAVPIVQSVTT